MSTTSPKVSRESLTGGHVKGAMVRAHLQFIADCLGQPAMARTMEALPAGVAAEIQTALPSTWCAFESLILFDRAIARAAGREESEMMRDLGRYSAQINLSTIYRAFHREDIHDFFRHSATLHKQFQDFGTCQYEPLENGHGRISVRDAKCFSPAYCGSEIGYLEQVITTHGGKPRVTESACQCLSDDHCTFDVRWS